MCIFSMSADYLTETAIVEKGTTASTLVLLRKLTERLVVHSVLSASLAVSSDFGIDWFGLGMLHYCEYLNFG